MRYIKTIFSIFILLGILESGLTQHSALRKEIDKIIRFDTEIDVENHPGFIIGIIDNDSTYILTYGKNAIDTNEIFEIGGLTKVFTALYTLNLAEKGMLNLDSSINYYLLEPYRNPLFESYAVNDLLIHNIPFPKRPADLSKKEMEIDNPYAYYTKEDVLNYYSNFVPPPKRKWWQREILHYSHINFALLEIILENATGKDFTHQMEIFIQEQISMKNSGFTFPDSTISTGYDYSNAPCKTWKYQSFQGSEGMKSNLEDLLSFTRKNLFLENSEGKLINNSLENLKKSQVSNKLYFSPVWYILKSRKTGAIFTHSGSTEGHKAYVHFKPETGTGVVILSKSIYGTGELGMLILRMINYNWKRKIKSE